MERSTPAKGAMMEVALKFLAGAAVAVIPGAALACSCALPPASEADAQLEAATASVDLVVSGEVVAETDRSACRGPLGVPVAAYRTLEVSKVYKGGTPKSIKVRVGDVTPVAEGCARTFMGCNVEPRLGASGVWSLKRKGDDWLFADYCTTMAIRRAFGKKESLESANWGGKKAAKIAEPVRPDSLASPSGCQS